MKIKVYLISLICISLILSIEIINYKNDTKVIEVEAVDVAMLKEEMFESVSEEIEDIEESKEIVYDNMTIEELGEKIERNLNSTLTGYGYLFASYSLEKGVDPYLAVAISLHETGCKWNCSTLVNKCNNVGGQKGSPSCNGGSYRAFSTLEEGIKGFIDNIYRNYTSKGLITAEQMSSKYAASTSWATKVNIYIEKIKAS